jgi:hypothetical protein
MKKLVCIMAVGKKYKTILKRLSKKDGCYGGRFKQYADRCGADFVVIDEALDTENYRNILFQKLLIPSKFEDYDLVLFLDMDLAINENCPSLFEILPENYGLAAVLSPVNEDKYQKAWSHVEHIKHEAPKKYFLRRNFEVSDSLIGDINGGVLLFRPPLVSKLFSDYYFSHHDQGQSTAYEEAPMAYYSQVNNIFYPLDERFNCQFFYELYTPSGDRIVTRKSSFKERLKNLVCRFTFKDERFDVRYYGLLEKLVSDNFIVHFSGNFSYELLMGRLNNRYLLIAVFRSLGKRFISKLT